MTKTFEAEPVRWSDIYNTPHSLRVAIEGPIMAKSPAWTGERVVIMDTPANIAPEPDWKGLLEELEDSIVGVMNEGTFVPNVTLAKLNIVLVRLNAALAAARKAVGK